MRKKLMAMLLCVAMLLTLLPTFAFATETEVSNESALTNAISTAGSGDTIKLMSGITLADTVTVDKNLTIDLNSKTLTATFEDNAIVCTSGTLTIKDGTLVSSATNSGCGVYANGAAIDVQNVTFDAASFCALAVGAGGQLTVTDSAINASHLYWADTNSDNSITITNTTVANLDKHTDSPATLPADKLTISGYVAKIGTANYLTLADAVAAATAGQTVELLADVPLTESVTVNKKITIDGDKGEGGRYTLTMDAGDVGYKPIFNMTSGCTLQNIEFNYKGTGYDDCAVYLDSTVDGVVVDTCKFTGDASAAGIIGTYGVKNVTVKNSEFSTLKYGMYLNSVDTATITDNTFDKTKYNAINIAGDSEANPCKDVALSGNKLTSISTGDYDDDTYSAGISFGKFTTNAVIDKDKDGSVSMLNDKKAVFAAKGAGVAIYGGVYSSNVGEYAADGLTAVNVTGLTGDEAKTPWHIETVSEFAGSGQKLIGGTAGDNDFAVINGTDSSKISVEAFYADATELDDKVQAAIAALPGNVIPIDVTLYYEGKAVTGAKLDNTIKVVIPFYGTAGTEYSVGHWNGTSFDIVPAEYNDVAHTLTFFAKEFSPYIIIDGVEYCKVYFNSGDGYAFKDYVQSTNPLVGAALKGTDYSFKLDVDAGYTLVKVLNNGTELPLGTPTGTGTKTYSFQLVNVTDVRNITAVVVKDEPVPAIMAKALEYTYADREAVGVSELTNGGYGVKYTIYTDELTLESGKVVMNDLARFFGALYRQDSNNGAKKITFKSVDYTWNAAGTLKGSNWENAGNTLVNAVVTEIGVLTNGATLSFKVDGEDVTLHLNILDRYTVKYDANEATGGAVPAADAKYDKGTTVTVLGNTNALVKTDCSFNGWNTKADGTGTSYAPGATFAATADVTLYAQWKADDTYTVTYNYTGVTDPGTYAEDAQVTVYNTDVTAPIPGDPFNKKIALIGWTCADIEGGTRLLEPGAKFAMPAKNVILDPVWAYKVNFVVGGTGVSLDGNAYNAIVYRGNPDTDPVYKVYYGGRFSKVSENITLPADPTRDGYTFKGWLNSVDGNANIAACDPETWADESNVITVYAKWTCDYADPNAVTLPEQTMADGTYALYYSQYLVAVKTDSNNRVYRNFKLTDANGYDVVSSTVLPAGLYLNERTGEIYGVPTKVESKTFNVAVFDDEDNRISDVYTFTIEVKTLPLEVDAYKAMTKTYGDNDPIYQGAFLNYKLNGENMNVGAAAVDFDKTHVVVAPSTTDSTATFTYSYQAAYTSRTANEATFTPVTASTLKYAPDLTNKIEGVSVTVALNTMSKVDTVTAGFERNTKYEDVGEYKLFLDAANLTGADDGYTLTVAPAFADKNLTYNEEEELTTTAKYLFTINAKSGLTYTVTKTYGEVKGGTVLTGEGTWTGLVNNDGILVVDGENTVKAVAGLSPLSGAQYLKYNASAYTDVGMIEYTLKNTVFDSTKDGSTAPAGTKLEATTGDYETATLSLTINQKALTVADNTVNVTKGTAPTAANIAALATLNGVLTGDTVTLTVASYDYDGTNYTNVDDLITALDKISADKEVTVNFTALSGADAENYTLTSGNVTGTLHAYTPSYGGGGGGGGGAVTTYKITCGTGVTADKKNASANATVTLTVAEGYEDVVVKDKNGKTVAVTEGKNGKYTFKMPASDVTVSVDAAVDTVCIDFDDVVLDAWSHAGIHYCLENGMMNGVAADTFAPGVATTRAMIVTMLARLSGYSVNGAGNQWYVPSMEWAVANGVSDGTMMTANITREQLATMLYRYAVEIAKIDVDKFTADTNTLSYDDVFTVSEWANAGVHFCLASGIIGGYEDNTIRPQKDATRAEVAKMFMSFCENVLAK